MITCRSQDLLQSAPRSQAAAIITYQRCSVGGKSPQIIFGDGHGSRYPWSSMQLCKTQSNLLGRQPGAHCAAIYDRTLRLLGERFRALKTGLA